MKSIIMLYNFKWLGFSLAIAMTMSSCGKKNGLQTDIEKPNINKEIEPDQTGSGAPISKKPDHKRTPAKDVNRPSEDSPGPTPDSSEPSMDAKYVACYNQADLDYLSWYFTPILTATDLNDQAQSIQQILKTSFTQDLPEALRQWEEALTEDVADEQQKLGLARICAVKLSGTKLAFTAFTLYVKGDCPASSNQPGQVCISYIEQLNRVLNSMKSPVP